MGFLKFNILFIMCWVAEGTKDLRNCWEYKWEFKWGTSNHEGFSEYIRIQFYNVETWLTSQPVDPRTAEKERGREHMAQQLGTINRISPAAWGPSNAECLIGKAWILLRDQGIHGNVKAVRPGLRLWTKERTRKLFHLGRQKTQRGAEEPSTPRAWWQVGLAWSSRDLALTLE